MIHGKPIQLVYQHQNPKEGTEALPYNPTLAPGEKDKNYIKLGEATTNNALNKLAGAQKLNQPNDTPEKHEDYKDTMQGTTEETLKEQMKQTGLDPAEYNIARHPSFGVWIAKKKIETGGTDKSQPNYQSSREDVIKFNILMGGRQIEEYEIQRTVMGTYSAKRKIIQNP